MSASELMNVRRVKPEKLSEWASLHIASMTSELPKWPLEDDEWTEKVTTTAGKELSVPEKISVSIRRDLVEIITTHLVKNGLTVHQVLNDPGLMAWLAALWEPFFRRRFLSSNIWHTFEAARIIPSERYDRNYRHVIGGPLLLFEINGEDASFVLDGTIKTRCDVLEQLVSVPHLVANKEFIAVVNRLYHDDKARYANFGPKTHNGDIANLLTGFASGAGGAGGGSARRLRTVYQQFNHNFVLSNMTRDELFEFLPSEFDKFKAGGKT